MEPRPDDYFKGINFDKSWEEEDWEKFFDAQERLIRDYHWVGTPPERPAADPSLSFRQVLRRFGMDPDSPNTPPRSFHYTGEEPSEEPHTPPGLKFWQQGADHESLPIYCQAKCYAYRVVLLIDARFSKFLAKTYKSRSHQEFQKALAEWRRVAQAIPRLVAEGHRLGYDPTGVKGNIVFCRRALARTDACVGLLSKIPVRHWSRPDHQRFTQETLRLRNALHQWIDLLRERFAPRSSRP
jgi:hypothetical protein